MSGSGGAIADILLWSGLLIGAFVLLVAIAAWIKRRLRAPTDADGAPFTLHELRTLHAKGSLSDEEFERAKAALLGSRIGKARGSAGDTPPHAPPDTPPDPAPRGNATPPTPK